MAQLERSSFNSLSSKGSVSTGAQDIAALDADCPKIVNYFGGGKPTPTWHIGLGGEPLVSVYY